MSALGFTDADLVANRAGRLGPRQVYNARFYAAVWSIMGALFLLAMGVALWAQLNRDDHTATDIVAVFAFAIVISGTCFTLAFWKLRAFAPHRVVRCLTGKVRPHEKASTWYVGEQVFRGPGASGGNYARNGFARLLADQPVCNVYVLPGGTAVSIERLE
jgi:hypothetical protein